MRACAVGGVAVLEGVDAVAAVFRPLAIALHRRLVAQSILEYCCPVKVEKR